MNWLIGLLLLFISACKRPTNEAYAPKAGPEGSCSKVEFAQFASPRNIEEAVAFINSLPKPLELKCFLKALERPLRINATTSTLSLQKANGPGSPRIFIFKEDLIMAIKPDGDGTYLLELSELLSDMRSIKAEVQLPLYKEVTLASAFEKIDREGKTSCGGCHLAEREEGLRDGALVYSSYALKPTESQLMSLQELERESYNCEFQDSGSRRCLVLKELLDNGDVIYQDFPVRMPTMMETFSF